MEWDNELPGGFLEDNNSNSNNNNNNKNSISSNNYNRSDNNNNNKNNENRVHSASSSGACSIRKDRKSISSSVRISGLEPDELYRLEGGGGRSGAGGYVKQLMDKRKLRYVLRKSAAVPVAVLYGVILYLILQYLIFSTPQHKLHTPPPDRNTRANTTTRTAENSQTNEENVRANQPNDTRRTVDSPTDYLPNRHTATIGYVSSAFTFSIGVTTIFSRGARCFTLLVVPGAVSGNNQGVLFTFIMGMLTNGPFDSLVYNFNEISLNPHCMHQAVSKMARSSIMKLNSLHRVIRQLRSLFEDAFGADNLFDSKVRLQKDFRIPRISALRDRQTMIKGGIDYFRQVVSVIGKCLVGMSLVLMVANAGTYLRNFYSDNSFDNMYVNEQVTQVWMKKCYQVLLPLRNWELNEGYKVSSASTFTKAGLFANHQSIFSTVLFTLFANLIMLADYLLAQLLNSIEYRKKIVISFADVDETFENAGRLIIEKFNNATESCLPYPKYTSTTTYALIYFLLVIALIACLFNVNLARFQTMICNTFYSERAEERAVYLYHRLHIGRTNRQTNVKSIVIREIDRRRRLKSFFPWSGLRVCRWRLRHRHKILCPGCGWEVKYFNAKDVCLVLDKTVTNGKICMNCHLDFNTT